MNIPFYLTGAEERNRTSDLLITNQLLYQLSYFSIKHRIHKIKRSLIFRQEFIWIYVISTDLRSAFAYKKILQKYTL